MPIYYRSQASSATSPRAKADDPPDPFYLARDQASDIGCSGEQDRWNRNTTVNRLGTSLGLPRGNRAVERTNS